jgi:hypothetical protein
LFIAPIRCEDVLLMCNKSGIILPHGQIWLFTPEHSLETGHKIGFGEAIVLAKGAGYMERL